jgi:hypothetical protein
MFSSATINSESFDWTVWAPGFALPVACILADFAIGEYVLWFAPAGLLCLAAIGMTALALSRNDAAGFLVVGPIWAAGVLALTLGVVLAAVSFLGVVLSLGMLGSGHALGLLFLACSILGFTPLWTGVTYLERARVLTKQGINKHGARKGNLHALLGAAITVSAVMTAQGIDSGWVARRIATLEEATPAVWEATFASLRAYPLCGRERCRWLVCARLLQKFPTPQPDGIIERPDVPAHLDAVFERAYGESTRKTCQEFD